VSFVVLGRQGLVALQLQKKVRDDTAPKLCVNVAVSRWVPELVSSDNEQLRQLLWNGLSNAIKVCNPATCTEL
jgi:signal transduction histidine kinase